MSVQLGPNLGDPIEAQATERINAGILTGLTVSLPTGAAITMSLYVQAGITKSADIYQNHVVELIQAYVDDTTPASWTGFLPITEQSLLYLSIKGNGNPIIICKEIMLIRDTIIFPGVTFESLFLPRV